MQDLFAKNCWSLNHKKRSRTLCRIRFPRMETTVLFRPVMQSVFRKEGWLFSQLITRPGTKVRVWFETDRVLPEIAMIARGNPTKSAGKKVASTEGGSTEAAMPSQARPIVRIKKDRESLPLYLSYSHSCFQIWSQQDSLLQCHLRLRQVHYRHGMIRMLDVNTICKEGDIGLMIAMTLNIRFRTSSKCTCLFA